MHNETSPLAGQTVTLASGQSFAVTDWFDRIAGSGWHAAAEAGNATAINYAMRMANPKTHFPPDDEVLVGTIGPVPYLAHVSEIAP